MLDLRVDLKSDEFRLENKHVKLALAGYDCSRAAIRDYLLAEGVFRDDSGPFGFKLSRVEAARKTVSDVIEKGRRAERLSVSKLGLFQRELILATADATRRDQEQLVLHLYTALMERHAANPPGEKDDTEASEAGEYLLRCMAVQAAYDNLSTYRFVVEQFARVVAAIRLHQSTAGLSYMLPCLLMCARAPMLAIQRRLKSAAGDAARPVFPVGRRKVVFVEGASRISDRYENVEELRCARSVGVKLAANSHVVLVWDRGDENSLVEQVRLGAVESGGRVLCVSTGHKGGSWVPTGQTMTVRLGSVKTVETLVELLAEATVDVPNKDWDVNSVNFNKQIDFDRGLETRVTLVGFLEALRLFLADPLQRVADGRTNG